MKPSKPLQLSVRYSPEEDRIVLLIGTPKNEEYRFLLTRRLVKSLIERLVNLLSADIKAIETAGPLDLKAAAMQFRHQQAVSTGNFEKTFQTGAANFPLGEQPVLVTGYSAQPHEHGFALALRLTKGQDFNMVLPKEVIHCLYQLLADSIVSADWDIDIAFMRGKDKPGDMNRLM